MHYISYISYITDENLKDKNRLISNMKGNE
jgi:hypothetical protein